MTIIGGLRERIATESFTEINRDAGVNHSAKKPGRDLDAFGILRMQLRSIGVS